MGLSMGQDTADGTFVPDQRLLMIPREVPSTLRPLETPGISPLLPFWGAEQGFFPFYIVRTRNGASAQFHIRWKRASNTLWPTAEPYGPHPSHWDTHTRESRRQARSSGRPQGGRRCFPGEHLNPTEKAQVLPPPQAMSEHQKRPVARVRGGQGGALWGNRNEI